MNYLSLILWGFLKPGTKLAYSLGMDAKFFIVHDDRALIGRYARLADAVRCCEAWHSAGVIVTPENEITDPHLLARLAHWQAIDKRGRRR